MVNDFEKRINFIVCKETLKRLEVGSFFRLRGKPDEFFDSTLPFRPAHITVDIFLKLALGRDLFPFAAMHGKSLLENCRCGREG